jgi:MFS family permease
MPSATTNSNWLPLVTTLAIQALVSMAVLTAPVIAPVVAQALGASAAYLGLYIAIVYVGAMLASLGAGAAVKRFGAIRVSQSGLLLCAAGLLLCVVPAVWAFVLGGLLIGLGYGPITPASSWLLAQTTPAHRMSLVFSVKQTGVPLGGMLAGALVPSLMLGVGWQGALIAVALANIATAALSQPLRAELDADREPGKPLQFGSLVQPIRMVLSQRALATLAACSFVFSTAQLVLTGYLVTYLTQVLAYGLVTAGLALSVAQIGGVGGRIVWGYIADRWLGANRTLAWLAFIMAISSVATALLQVSMPTLLVFAILFVFGASATGWNGVYLAEVARRAPPGMAGIATGGSLAITFLGVVLGPPVFGALSASFGSFRAGYAALAIPVALCGIVLLRARQSVGAFRERAGCGAGSALVGAGEPTGPIAGVPGDGAPTANGPSGRSIRSGARSAGRGSWRGGGWISKPPALVDGPPGITRTVSERWYSGGTTVVSMLAVPVAGRGCAGSGCGASGSAASGAGAGACAASRCSNRLWNQSFILPSASGPGASGGAAAKRRPGSTNLALIDCWNTSPTIGNALWAPWPQESAIVTRLSLKPTHAPATRLGCIRMNQPSVLSWVVPVLPATSALMP